VGREGGRKGGRGGDNSVHNDQAGGKGCEESMAYEVLQTCGQGK